MGIFHEIGGRNGYHICCRRLGQSQRSSTSQFTPLRAHETLWANIASAVYVKENRVVPLQLITSCVCKHLMEK